MLFNKTWVQKGHSVSCSTSNDGTSANSLVVANGSFNLSTGVCEGMYCVTHTLVIIECQDQYPPLS